MYHQPQNMVQKRSGRISVATDGNALINTVGRSRNDVIQLVRHTTRSRDIRDTSWSIELRHEDVVQHATGVTDLKAAWLQAANSRRSDYHHVLLVRLFDHSTCELFRDAFCYDSNATDLN